MPIQDSSKTCFSKCSEWKDFCFFKKRERKEINYITFWKDYSSRGNSKKENQVDFQRTNFLYSPWDWGQTGIKKRTNHVIYHWKAYLSGSQKNHVNTILSVIFNMALHCRGSRFHNIIFFEKNTKKMRPFILSIHLI